jgi:NitT/TauT family transport system substrate-binding protein
MFKRVDDAQTRECHPRRRIGARTLPVLAMAATAAIAVSACGSSSSSSSSASGGGSAAASSSGGGSSSGKTTTVTVSAVPFYANAALGLGQKVGIFAHYGLKVNLETSANVNVTLADIHSGHVQFGFASTPLVASADVKGQGVKCVAPLGPANTADAKFPENAVMVAKGSSITSIKDLKGKTVGLNQLAGSNQLYLDIALANAGLSSSDVQLATVPFADQGAAIKSGKISAGFLVPPFIHQTEAAGQTQLLADLDSVTSPDTQDCYVASSSYVSSNQSTVDNFVKAVNQSILYAKKYPSQYIAEVGPVSGLSEAAAKSSVPPGLVLTDDLAPASIVKYEDLMVKAKALDGKPLSASQIAYVTPGTPMTKLLFANGGKYTG